MNKRQLVSTWEEARSVTRQGMVAVLPPGRYVVPPGQPVELGTGSGLVAAEPGTAVVAIVNTPTGSCEAVRVRAGSAGAVVEGLVFDTILPPLSLAAPVPVAGGVGGVEPEVRTIGVRTMGPSERLLIRDCRVERLSEFFLDEGGATGSIVSRCVSTNLDGLRRHFVWQRRARGGRIDSCVVANSKKENEIRLSQCDDMLVCDSTLANVSTYPDGTPIPGDANKGGVIDFQGGTGHTAVRNTVSRGAIRCGPLASSATLPPPDRQNVIAFNRLIGDSWIQVVEGSEDVVICFNEFLGWKGAAAAPICVDTAGGKWGLTSERVRVFSNRFVGTLPAKLIAGSGPREAIQAWDNGAA